MKKQNSPQTSCKQPERSCKVPILPKKHSCKDHSTNRIDTDERPKSGKNNGKSTKNFCPCNPCSCDNCPDVLQLLNKPISNRGLEDLSFGLCPKSTDPKPASCSNTCTEVVRPKPIKLDMITYDDECTCELIARAIRADVHRYLSLVDRTPKPKLGTKCGTKACPECIAESITKANPKNDFKSSPESMASIPKSKIKFCDSDIDRNLNACLQPDA